MSTRRFCGRCGNQLSWSDVKGYTYVCHHCDENMFRFEAYNIKKPEEREYIKHLRRVHN